MTTSELDCGKLGADQNASLLAFHSLFRADFASLFEAQRLFRQRLSDAFFFLDSHGFSIFAGAK